MNNGRNQGWPPYLAVENHGTLKLRPRPKVQPALRLMPYTGCCPNCGQMHMTKAQFIECRVALKGQ